MINTTHSATPVAQLSLQTELEDLLFLVETIGSEEALTSVSCLIDDYTTTRHDESLIASAASNTMRFYSNAALLKSRIQQVIGEFCGEGGVR